MATRREKKAEYERKKRAKLRAEAEAGDLVSLQKCAAEARRLSALRRSEDGVERERIRKKGVREPQAQVQPQLQVQQLVPEQPVLQRVAQPPVQPQVQLLTQAQPLAQASNVAALAAAPAAVQPQAQSLVLEQQLAMSAAAAAAQPQLQQLVLEQPLLQQPAQPPVQPLVPLQVQAQPLAEATVVTAVEAAAAAEAAVQLTLLPSHAVAAPALAQASPHLPEAPQVPALVQVAACPAKRIPRPKITRVKLPLIASQISDLAETIRDGFSRAQRRNSKSACVWILPDKSILYANGFSWYSNVHADVHNTAQQRKNTCILNVGDHEAHKSSHYLLSLCSVMPALGVILRFCYKKCPSLRVAHCHILRQASEHARFAWHTDNDPGDFESKITRSVKKTFVFNLTSSHTSMQLQGEEEFFFKKPGVGALFDSAVVHKTVKADDKTLKLAVFMYDPDECV